MNTKSRSNAVLALTAALALSVGVCIGYAVGHSAPGGGPGPAPTAQSAPHVPTAADKTEAGVEAAARDVFATTHAIEITKEMRVHYCDDILTAAARARTPQCASPKDEGGFADTLMRVDQITITGESATANVDYRSARGGTYQSTTLYFEWENEKWRENPK